MSSKSYDFHPISDLFPLMGKDEFLALKNDIAANGLLNPVLVYEGKILDGRNRYMACMDLEVDPDVVDYVADNPLSYVISTNLHRRHLTPSQKACIAVDALTFFEEEAKGRMSEGGKGSAKLRYLKKGKASEHAARSFNVSPRYVEDAKRIREEDPESFVLMRTGKKTLQEVKKEHKKKRRAERREQAIKEKAHEHGDKQDITLFMADITRPVSQIQNDSLDYVITDPPYKKEYIPLYNHLGAFCKEKLKDTGFLVCMTGQLYMNRYIEEISEHLFYHWICAYMTPGDSTSIPHANVATNWKPLLVFKKNESTKPPFQMKDVYLSPAPDRNHHHWGQSVEGFIDIIDRMTVPGSLICDPFLGGGTTALAALATKRKFIGFDVDNEAYETATRRVYSTSK